MTGNAKPMNGIAAQALRTAEAGEPESLRLGILRENLTETILRVARVVDLETDMLRLNRPIDLASYNHQKSHGLLELTRALRAFGSNPLEPDLLASLAELRDKLKKNLAVLDIHLKAVRQVSALIARAIEEDNSDGTYSASINRMARHI
jgi:hypothetical protein